VRRNRAIGREQPWGMARGLEPTHTPLSRASRLMSILSAVVQRPVLSMFHMRQHLAQGRTVAFQRVHGDHPRNLRESLQACGEASRRRLLVALELALNDEKHLIQVPLVVRSRTPAARLVGVGLPERSAPIPDRFRGQANAAFSHERFDVPVAEANAKVQPDTIADHLCREPMTRVWMGCWW
jgi:hypothetical protein